MPGGQLMAAARVGVDVGGTFTDSVLIDEAGRLHITKVRTSNDDISRGFLSGLVGVSERGGVGLPEIEYLAHGTTVATNAIVEQKFDRTALITNVGFGDLLEIGSQRRRQLYDLWSPEPPPLVPRERCLEVQGRIGPQGEVVEPVEDADIRAAAEKLKAMEIESVAVTLLFSFVNSEHEDRIEEILRQELPGVPVSLSSRVAPEFREFLRASTTVLNASILPRVGGYIGRLAEELDSRSVSAPLHLMQSNGGVTHASTAREIPVALAASGPAAAVLGAARIGEAIGEKNLMVFDMGGTTADVSLVIEGELQLRFLGEHGGHEVNYPQVDLLSVGAGGGSIAAVDEYGRLTVGPRSAGSDPGPACYGTGGELPTVTDAHAVLGVLSPDQPLGGEVTVDVEAARKAITRHVAEPLEMTVEEGATAILRLANANMTNALRIVTVARGHDPRDFALAPLGGAGPMHVCAIAEELGVSRIVLPKHPGVGAAFGLLLSDIRHDLRQGWLRSTDDVEIDEFVRVVNELRDRGRTLTGGSGTARLQFEADIRYSGQAYSLTVPLPIEETSPEAALEAAEQSFHDLHKRLYDYSPSVTTTEIVTLRLSVIEPAGSGLNDGEEAASNTSAESRRDVWIDGGWTSCRIHSRGEMNLGDRVVGPAVIEQEDATTVVTPGWEGEVADGGNLILRKEVR